MNKVLTFILLLVSTFIFAQNKEKDKALEKSNDFVYEGNTLFNDDFVSAEKEYRKAISEVQTNAVGAYNLGNAYYKTGYYDEALLRHLEAAKNAITKDEKHKAYHNIGNVLMQQKSCKEAVEAFKNALRNDPTDEESRYNLALAKECAQQQGGGSDDEKGDDEKKEGDDEQEKKDGDKDNEDEKNKDEGENKEDQNSEGDDQQDQKDGNDKDDENGKPKDEGKNDGNPNQKPQPKQPQPGKLSPQQVKNLLEAMNNQEKKVQDKINAKKAKGVKVKTEKDW